MVEEHGRSFFNILSLMDYDSDEHKNDIEKKAPEKAGSRYNPAFVIM